MRNICPFKQLRQRDINLNIIAPSIAAHRCQFKLHEIRSQMNFLSHIAFHIHAKVEMVS